MIPRTAATWQTSNWQKSLAEAIRDPQELLTLLELPLSLLPAARKAAELFPLRVTRSYLSRIEPGNINDPLLRQVLPLQAELEATPAGYSHDPVGDLDAMATPGLLHKYQGRVLLVTTAACAIHCRYCFRRHFPYSEAQGTPEHWQASLDYIRNDGSISEVILSGGDPLSLSNQRLASLLGQLAEIRHLKRVRIHSRYPVILPERIDAELLGLFEGYPLELAMVVHCNHPREINNEVKHILKILANNGCFMLNQSVLLDGVNNELEALKDLSEALFSAGVLPYYLHQLDKVTGASHFAVSEKQALQLQQQLREALPGYLVPKLVIEQAGAASKIPLGESLLK